MSNNHNSDRTTTADPFSTFWTDFFTRIGAPPEALRGAMPAPAASNDMLKQMQRVFLDALAKYCDDYMRSEQFLQMMKQTLDRSLAFKQQLDQFLGQAQKGMQAPARADIDDLAGTMRSFEARVLTRLDELEHKAAAVEGSRRTARIPAASRGKRPSRRAPKPGKRRKK